MFVWVVLLELIPGGLRQCVPAVIHPKDHFNCSGLHVRHTALHHVVDQCIIMILLEGH